ncbi:MULTISPECIES: A/G-specific adenine glycosylase [unclassified Undibacterium]|uniref:A/G-specific adenine glycosylase n=1 Tax=unclassified Undibacterium TaxID=2630295 RepID=UPI002AC90D76|nr:MULTISPECIES: A/G-specific adenine glycosylase [unclassified Undibacterium]MEB0140342.1 A/G-specific adenine glycosylase [Undibacterium sp. CCC2.1]MEB0172335.1 A/G-specific adenine glycosylase [Undibacterium sp. CCC1.1]MEB0176251.1 A/G-specific adenine glycosylase [Undibacterium sp. CCC3.4]MEB0215509.1 A/G-specific adenine glycosylase [Undibacterium sp. 5I2]WPX44345.1 A/G-specific adenine glycosylase [Undibacterium sp. CCC3.4]
MKARIAAVAAAQFTHPEYLDPSFSHALIRWQKSAGRHALPWQQSRAAYRVWLSEIMLQQTQVTAVIPYYQKFLHSFPTVQALAAAPAQAVMEHWSGLGYYTRARNLHQCAKQVVAEYAGEFPADPGLLAQLPGIGRSTAAAITAFSYGTVAAILDGNVKRVFARVFGIAGYPGSKPVETLMWQRAEALLPETEIEAYTQGLMDLGATVCTRSRPQCGICPMQARCVAYAQDRTAELPTRKPKKAQRHKQALMLVMINDRQVLLERRPDSGIWGGLLSLPEFDGMQEHDEATHAAAQLDPALHTLIARFGQAAALRPLPPIEHVFTHFKLHIQPCLVELHQRYHFAGQDQYVWTNLSELATAALPAPIKTLLLSLQHEAEPAGYPS